MRDWAELAKIPKRPGVYCLIAASARPYIAYVGIAGELQGRLLQHLSYRDSSVVTGASATSISPNLIASVVWWCTDEMDDKVVREAAELVAFDVLDPGAASGAAPSSYLRIRPKQLAVHRAEERADAPLELLVIHSAPFYAGVVADGKSARVAGLGSPARHAVHRQATPPAVEQEQAELPLEVCIHQEQLLADEFVWMVTGCEPSSPGETASSTRASAFAASAAISS